MTKKKYNDHKLLKTEHKEIQQARNRHKITTNNMAALCVSFRVGVLVPVRDLNMCKNR